MSNKIKIGVFGVRRGLDYIKVLSKIDEAEVIAICDNDEEKVQTALKYCPAGVKVCADYNELIDSGICAVILCNNFNEHVPYAIQAMRKGIHVLSECIPAATLKECAQLVDTVEETGCTYAFAENYPYMRSNMELARVFKSGVLGELSFAEGEYVHPFSHEEWKKVAPTDDHWRKHLPKTYYLSHSLAPLMVATDRFPRKVIGKVVPGWQYASERGRTDGDGGGIMLVEMDGGAVFRISGSCDYGAKGNWYRLCCQKGEIENIRGTTDKVRLAINDWEKTEATAQFFNGVSIYEPPMNELGKKAMSSGHGGGDFWVTWYFIRNLVEKTEPYMNVYRAAAIAATGILGWRSVLNGSKEMEIPDFRNKEARAQCYNDDLTPFPTAEEPATLPCRKNLFKNN